jgi:hypothetical protein
MMTSADSFEVVVVDTDDADDAIALGKEHGVSIERINVAGFEPVSTVALAITGAALAVSMVVYLLDRRKGGQVIDLRAGAPKTIYRTCDVTYGYVVIVAADGTVRVEVREPRGMFGQVSELIVGIVGELAGNNAADVAGMLSGRLSTDVAQISIAPEAG